MGEKCKFLDGVNTYRCHQTKALPELRAVSGFGHDEVSLTELRSMVCESDRTEEERSIECPALRNLLEAGSRSQFAKPIANNRPLR